LLRSEIPSRSRAQFHPAFLRNQSITCSKQYQRSTLIWLPNGIFESVLLATYERLTEASAPVLAAVTATGLAIQDAAVLLARHVTTYR
jgi:hypothetical protein